MQNNVYNPPRREMIHDLATRVISNDAKRIPRYNALCVFFWQERLKTVLVELVRGQTVDMGWLNRKRFDALSIANYFIK